MFISRICQTLWGPTIKWQKWRNRKRLGKRSIARIAKAANHKLPGELNQMSVMSVLSAKQITENLHKYQLFPRKNVREVKCFRENDDHNILGNFFHLQLTFIAPQKVRNRKGTQV